MPSKLEIYNGALIEIGERMLSSLTESGEPRRVLDAVYDRVVGECLAMGSWNFAMETVQLDADTGVTPNFGYSEVFAKPADWVRTHGVSQDEFMTYPMTQYFDDSTYLSADVSPIYVRYVSNDTGMGLDLSKWTQNFTRYVELELAERVCDRLTQNSSKRDEIMKRRDKARRTALNHDAMNEPNPKFPPPGGWTVSRWGSSSSGDRGSRNSLTG